MNVVAMFRQKISQLIVCAASLVVATMLSVNLVQAQDAASRLQMFVQETGSFSADFEQTLYDADSTVLQVSTGTIQLKRPGKFVWTYESPNVQRLVSDGESLWMYDIELEQVTVSPLQDRVGGTPLVLLMGTRPVEEEFSVKPLANSDGIDWFELVPKTETTDFESLFVGLNEQGLAVMELRDNFGQATQILFSNTDTDAVFQDAVFDFQVPSGVDVIGQ